MDYPELNGYEKTDIGAPLMGTECHKHDHEKTDIRGDRANIAILFFLYLLQGIPLGLTAAIPMLLQNRGASYKQQAEFSFATWPFSMKLLWAPIVDSLFWPQFGRRKSWLIPTQYLIGIFMLVLSSHVKHWLEGGHLDESVPALTALFFSLNFLAATQDIAVDGWALTMLKRCNVGHASTCNSVGQTAGYFFGYVVFIALESKEFCNTYLRSVPHDDGLITLPGNTEINSSSFCQFHLTISIFPNLSIGFLWFWGLIFLVTTTLVAFLKKEQDRSLSDHDDGHTEENLNIVDTYKLLWKIVNMRPIKILAAILLTVKFTFAAVDSVTSLKLVEVGLPKDKLALLAIPMVPLQIVLPLAVSKFTTGPKPMEVYIKAIPFRIIFGLFASAIVALTPYTLGLNGDVPYYVYVVLLVNYSFYQVCLYCMFVAVMAFFAKISDPAVGGTYMTLLNTICNLGGNWPTSIVLWLVDVLTWKKCANRHSDLDLDNTCASKSEEEVSEIEKIAQ